MDSMVPWDEPNAYKPNGVPIAECQDEFHAGYTLPVEAPLGTCAHRTVKGSHHSVPHVEQPMSCVGWRPLTEESGSSKCPHCGSETPHSHAVDRNGSVHVALPALVCLICGTALR